MYIRKAAEGDLPRMMEIYAVARRFMAAHGNPNQWGPTNWPPEERIRADIAEGSSYVCVRQNRVVGAFYFRQGEGIEPTYQRIENGAWKEAGPYGVIHRRFQKQSLSSKKRYGERFFPVLHNVFFSHLRRCFTGMTPSQRPAWGRCPPPRRPFRSGQIRSFAANSA